MPFQDFCSKKLTTWEKIRVGVITALCAVLGASLGVVAYHQQWLG